MFSKIALIFLQPEYGHKARAGIENILPSIYHRATGSFEVADIFVNTASNSTTIT